jgi:hypothetical protein
VIAVPVHIQTEPSGLASSFGFSFLKFKVRSFMGRELVLRSASNRPRIISF